jgi:predicted Zn-dependent protease
MATAGYDPRAAQDLWELMSAVEADNAAKGETTMENRFAMLRTHPTSEARHQALEKDMESALGKWKEHMKVYWAGIKAKEAKEKLEQEEAKTQSKGEILDEVAAVA